MYVLNFRSKIAKIVIHSIIAERVHALVKEFDGVFVTTNGFQAIYNSIIYVDMFTKPKQVFRFVTKSRGTSKNPFYY